MRHEFLDLFTRMAAWARGREGGTDGGRARLQLGAPAGGSTQLTDGGFRVFLAAIGGVFFWRILIGREQDDRRVEVVRRMVRLLLFPGLLTPPSTTFFPECGLDLVGLLAASAVSARLSLL